MTYTEALAHIHLLDHPLARVNMTILRDAATPPVEFRRALRRLSAALAWFALEDAALRAKEVRTPLAPFRGAVLARSVVLVPILRAGLGFMEAMLEVLPEAAIGHIGLERNEKNHLPGSYYTKFPPHLGEKEVLVLDPMLATGRSAAAALRALQEAGAQHLRFVGLVGCPEGVSTLVAAHPGVPIYLAALDEGLNAHCYIVPGLGDAGDRFFGTL